MGNVSISKLSYFNVFQSAVTHTDGGRKTSMALEWTPSMKYVGEVRMVATVVKGFSTFWVNVQSETVKVSN